MSSASSHKRCNIVGCSTAETSLYLVTLLCMSNSFVFRSSPSVCLYCFMTMQMPYIDTRLCTRLHCIDPSHRFYRAGIVFCAFVATCTLELRIATFAIRDVAIGRTVMFVWSFGPSQSAVGVVVICCVEPVFLNQQRLHPSG